MRAARPRAAPAFRLAAVLAAALGPAVALADDGEPPLHGVSAVQEVPTAIEQTRSREIRGLTIEQLMDVDISVAARRTERVLDAAAAVTVVSAEDIRRSGVTTLPEALRLAHGLAVARFNGGTWAISARGFDITTANKLLVMIDGRTVYTPLFGGVLWDGQVVMLEEIERIEVIRGPGATAWGANAVNGAINVITRAAADSRGAAFSSWAGNEERGGIAARYGGALGPTGDYRVYGRVVGRDANLLATGTSADDDLTTAVGGVRADLTRGAHEMSLQAEVFGGREGLLRRDDIELGGGHVLGRWRQRFSERSTLEARAYYDRTRRLVPLQFEEIRGTWDIELQHEWRPHPRHGVIWGAGYRASRDDTRPTMVIRFDPEDRTVALANLFVVDEIALLPELSVTLGAKVEYNGYTGVEPQPTARVRWHLPVGHTLWGAVSRAVRIPTRFDNDLRVPGQGPPVLRGDAGIDPEKATAYEAGYRAPFGLPFSIDVAAFVNRYTDLRSQEPPTAPGEPVVLANGQRATSRGFEAVLNFQPRPWLRAAGSYAFFDLDFQRAPGSGDLTLGRFEANDPRHQVAFRWQSDVASRLELDGAWRWVGQLPFPLVESYAELDLRVGWRWTEEWNISLVGRDLLNDAHQEFAAPTTPVRHEFERSVAVRLAYGY